MCMDVYGLIFEFSPVQSSPVQSNQTNQTSVNYTAAVYAMSRILTLSGRHIMAVAVAPAVGGM